MLQEDITIINKLGLHTRAAAKLVALASRFESKMEILHNDRKADCKSIMGIILLGVTKGNTLKLIITGADELEAREAIITLFSSRFGEAE
jgi:phosphocarrier protein HPr